MLSEGAVGNCGFILAITENIADLYYSFRIPWPVYTRIMSADLRASQNVVKVLCVFWELGETVVACLEIMANEKSSELQSIGER